jgi:hypothetical protein
MIQMEEREREIEYPCNSGILMVEELDSLPWNPAC